MILREEGGAGLKRLNLPRVSALPFFPAQPNYKVLLPSYFCLAFGLPGVSEQVF